MVSVVSAAGVEDPRDTRKSAFVQFETRSGWTMPMRALLDNGSQETILSRKVFDQIVREDGKVVAEDGYVFMVDAEGRPMSRMERFAINVRAPMVVNGKDESRMAMTTVNVRIDDTKAGDEIIISSGLSGQLGWAYWHEAEIEAIRNRTAPNSSVDAKKAAYTFDVLERSRVEAERLKGEAREVLSPTAADKICAKIDQAAGILLVDMLPGAQFQGVTPYGSESVAKEALVRPRAHHEPPRGSPRDVATRGLIETFVMLGILVACGGSPYAYPVFLVGTAAKWRLVANAVVAAQNVVRVPTTTLNADAEMQKQVGNKVFFMADVIKAFYMTPVVETVPDWIRSIVYGGKHYRFTRLIMGEVNSAEFLIRTMEQMFGHMGWLSKFMDDILGGAKGDDELADRFGEFIDVCLYHNVCLHVGKMKISRRCYWVGHFLSSEGISADPFSKQILWALPEPDNGEQLAKVIGSIEYFSKFIPDCARLMAPIRAVMERICKTAGSRKNSSVRKYKVTGFGWTAETGKRWTEIKNILANAITLKIRDPTMSLVLHTDASTTGWAGLLMQCPEADLTMNPKERRNQLLGCCGALFNATQQRWPTVEQEAFAVRRSVERMLPIIGSGSTLHVFTDNKVLSHVFDLKSQYVAQKEKLGQGRLIRWIADLSMIDFRITHVAGEDNELADIVSRLTTYPADEMPRVPDEDDFDDPNMPGLLTRIVSVVRADIREAAGTLTVSGTAGTGEDSRVVSVVRVEYNLRTVLDEDWVMPVVSHLRELIGRDGKLDAHFYALARKHNAVFDYEERVWKVRGAVLVPVGHLTAALMAQAHSFGGGHRGVETTSRLLSAVVFWPGMAADIRRFVDGCIHCIEKQSWMVPRPYGQQIMPQKRCDVVGFDYLDMGESEHKDYRKILVVMDKLTKFVHLEPAATESAESASKGLLRWMAKFGKARTWLSDEGTAFLNETVRELAKRLKTEHHFTTAHSSWANGKQERMNYTIANIFRTLLSESGLPASHWIHLVEIVEMILNHTSLESLGWIAPVQAFVGLQPTTPLDSFLDPTTKEWKTVKMDRVKLQRYVEEFVAEVEGREVILNARQEQSAARTREQQETRAGVKVLELERGDFVMVQQNTLHKHFPKLAKRWIGPARVLGFDKDKPQTVEIEYLNAPTARRQREKVHAKRVKFFELKGLTLTPELLAHSVYTSARKWNVERFSDLREVSPKVFEVLTEWEGFDKSEATWERLSTMFEDVPGLVREFLGSGVPERARGLLPKVLRLLFLKG